MTTNLSGIARVLGLGLSFAVFTGCLATSDDLDPVPALHLALAECVGNTCVGVGGTGNGLHSSDFWSALPALAKQLEMPSGYVVPFSSTTVTLTQSYHASVYALLPSSGAVELTTKLAQLGGLGYSFQEPVTGKTFQGKGIVNVSPFLGLAPGGEWELRFVAALGALVNNNTAVASVPVLLSAGLDADGTQIIRTAEDSKLVASYAVTESHWIAESDAREPSGFKITAYVDPMFAESVASPWTYFNERLCENGVSNCAPANGSTINNFYVDTTGFANDCKVMDSHGNIACQGKPAITVSLQAF
jgi:hypothetical protein